jgi:hypothetical protein
MHEPHYSLSLASLGDGTFVRSVGQANIGAGGGGGGWSDPLPLGAPYADAFHKSRAASARELVQQLNDRARFVYS